MRILKVSSLVAFLVVCLTAMFPQVGFAQCEPLIGTWKVNVGRPINTQQDFVCDGKDHPWAGSQVADTYALRRIDAYTLERIDKKAGKVVLTLRSVMAKDGKVRTNTTKGTNAKGEVFNTVVVYERQ